MSNDTFEQNQNSAARFGFRRIKRHDLTAAWGDGDGVDPKEENRRSKVREQRQIYCADADKKYDPQAIAALLKEHKGCLRHEIAQAIRRKKVPELVFAVLPPGVQP